MYFTYAVRVIANRKHRHFMGAHEHLFQAKHQANACVCGNATYAYVKDARDGCCVFHLGNEEEGRNPYDEQPIDPTTPTRQIPPYRGEQVQLPAHKSTDH